MFVFIYLVPGPVGSVSSTMDTTWAVISWSVPSYIPSNYPIITYEIGYHVLQADTCLLVDDHDDINSPVFNQYNKSSNSIFINITGLYGNTCYIFGVRAYTDNGCGAWTFITKKTLELPIQPSRMMLPTSIKTSISESLLVSTVYLSATPSTCITSTSNDSVIALSVSVGVLLILLTISVIVHIHCFIRYIIQSNNRNFIQLCRIKCPFTTTKQAKLV